MPEGPLTVNSKQAGFLQNLSRRKAARSIRRRSSLIWLLLAILSCAFSAAAQSPQLPPAQPPAGTLGDQQAPNEPPLGRISGTILDQTGAVVARAQLTLTREDQSLDDRVLSGDDGQFSFTNVPAGPFRLTISATGFATQTSLGTLRPGEFYIAPPIALALATSVTEVRVTPSSNEVAEEQLKAQEKQRVLGFVPNFYVSYIPNAAPLNSKQKFRLALKSTVDPVTFGVIGAFAGMEQAENVFSGYGQGAQGYGKRYGAAYADVVTGTFIGSAILPSLLKQDPRYFYKGTGSKRSRILYAIANSVICKGDDGRWQANYSSIVGSFASGGISNLYYPQENRGTALTFENSLIEIGEGAAANLLQEFVIRKLTPNLPGHQADKS